MTPLLYLHSDVIDEWQSVIFFYIHYTYPYQVEYLLAHTSTLLFWVLSFNALLNWTLYCRLFVFHHIPVACTKILNPAQPVVVIFVVVQLSAGKLHFYTVWLIILSVICQSSVFRRRDGERRFWTQVSKTRYTVSSHLTLVVLNVLSMKFLLLNCSTEN